MQFLKSILILTISQKKSKISLNFLAAFGIYNCEDILLNI